MVCPQCRTEVPNEDWNCPSCRINVYWAHEHFEELAERRRREGLRPSPATPAFLLSSSRRAYEERAPRVAHLQSKVREIARRVMREDGDA
jgi:hypothetical protein